MGYEKFRCRTSAGIPRLATGTVVTLTHFRDQLKAVNPSEDENRRWLFVPYDQLSDELGPLSREAPEELGIVLVENPWKASRRPYHKQKLALILSNLRHFALEQAARGVAVKHLVADGPYSNALARVVEKTGPLRAMEPAEWELRRDLEGLVREGALEIVPHEGWLTTPEDFLASQKKGPPYRMDAFYRHLRKSTGWLMEQGKPVGGKYSFDAENRKKWKGDPAAPEVPTFGVGPIKKEVSELIEARFQHHPGRLDMSGLPATRAEAHALWKWAKANCMKDFGTYEDAMSRHSAGLFHTRISPLVNLHRLLPRTLVQEALSLELPLNSKEGFLRQVLGWREFMRHVHQQTDGFRTLAETAPRPGDGGFENWKGRPWETSTAEGLDGGARPNHFGATQPLPPSYWGTPSGLNCLDQVVTDVWREGWSHHITRLMVLSNLATLLDVDPRELTDWFWVAYIDAFDWVVEPNVLGMGTFALGDLFTTKPYVSGSNYIKKMSDYCESCRFHPARDCPIGNLYWAFLDRHRDKFEENPRMTLVLSLLDKRSREEKEQARETFERVRRKLNAGARLEPSEFP